ncbi:MAG: hypothetical protein DRO08_03110 [Thermoprotei archaeon]|nr:MAG: hypothetical protein DRO08_03110 [Thermoprotei archaeon]
MGRVIKPEKATSRRKIIEDAIKDLDPALREVYRSVLSEISDDALEDDEYFKRILKRIEEVKRSFI